MIRYLSYAGGIGAVAAALAIGGAATDGQAVASAAPSSSATGTAGPRHTGTGQHPNRNTVSATRPRSVTSPITPRKTPTNPAQVSLFESFAGWVRRTFDNSTPVMKPQEVTLTVLPGQTSGPIRFTGGTDADGDTLTYTVKDPGSLTPAGTSFTVTPDSTWDGISDYTETVTVTASDAGNGFHIHGLPGLLHMLSFGQLGSAGDTATSTLTVHVNPVKVPGKLEITASVALTANFWDMVVGADGTVAQQSVIGHLDTVSGSILTVIHPDGTQTVVHTDDYASHPVVGPDGTTAQTSLGVLYVVHPDGSQTTVSAPWYPSSTHIAADGTTYVTSINGSSTGSTESTTIVVHPDGTYTSETAPGRSTGKRFGTDGTVAQAVYTGDTTVTVTHADGTVTTATTAGDWGDLQVGPDGTTYLSANGTVTVIRPDGSYAPLTTSDYVYPGIQIDSGGVAYVGTSTGTTEQDHQTTMTVIRPDGTQSSLTNAGLSSQILVGADSTAAQVVTEWFNGVGYGYGVAVLHADGTTTTLGVPFSGRLQVGADGTVAHLSAPVVGTGDGTLTVIHPDGTHTTFVAGGSNIKNGAAVGPDGTAYLTRWTYDLDGQSTVSAVHPDGTVTNIVVPDYPVDGVQVGPHGTVVQTSAASTYDNGLQTTETFIHPDDTVTTIAVPGYASYAAQFGSDGTIYQAGYIGSGTETDPYQTTMTVIFPDGTHAALLAPGRPNAPAQIGADGTIAQITRDEGTATDPLVFHLTVMAVNHP